MSVVDPGMPLAAGPGFRVPKLRQYSQLTGRWSSRRLSVAYFCTGGKFWSRILGQWVKPDQVRVASLRRLIEHAARASWLLTSTMASDATRGVHQIEKPNMIDCNGCQLKSA